MSSAGTSTGLAQVVFWPQPPLLLPGYASQVDLGAQIRRAALEALAAARPEPGPVLLLTGTDGATPTGERVALALLTAAGDPAPAAVVRVRQDADTAAVAEAADRLRSQLRELADGPEARPVTLLVTGDGTARASVRAPELHDGEAAAADERIAAAFAAGDPAALAAVTEAEARELLISGWAAWQVTAAILTGQRIRPAYAWFDRPFEVGYHVAGWRIGGPGCEN